MSKIGMNISHKLTTEFLCFRMLKPDISIKFSNLGQGTAIYNCVSYFLQFYLALTFKTINNKKTIMNGLVAPKGHTNKAVIDVPVK